MNLSPNFTLAEMIHSELATRKGLDNTPSAEVTRQLLRLCGMVLEPLRREVKRPVVVTSGYRAFAVNKAVGGAKSSAHMLGMAADLIVPGMTPLEVCMVIERLRLPYDKLIHEFGRWTHVAVAADSDAPRRELLTAKFVNGKVVYEKGVM